MVHTSHRYNLIVQVVIPAIKFCMHSPNECREASIMLLKLLFKKRRGKKKETKHQLFDIHPFSVLSSFYQCLSGSYGWAFLPYSGRLQGCDMLSYIWMSAQAVWYFWWGFLHSLFWEACDVDADVLLFLSFGSAGIYFNTLTFFLLSMLIIQFFCSCWYKS